MVMNRLMQLLGRCFECGIVVVIAVQNLEILPEFMLKEGMIVNDDQ